MPTIKTVTASTPVNASPEVVFDTVTNWRLQEKWVLATKIWEVGDHSRKLGGKLEAFTGIGRFGFLDTMTITKWDPPYICEVAHTGKIVKGSGLFKVTSNRGGAYFTWTEYTQVPFGIVGRIGWLAIRPMIVLSMKISLKKLSSLFKS